MLTFHKARCRSHVADRGATVHSLQPGRIYLAADPRLYVGPGKRVYLSLFDEQGRHQLVPAEHFEIVE